MGAARPRVVIIGGGFGGLYAARALAMAPANEHESPLTGRVQFDETYVGGKPRYKTRGETRITKKGRAPDFHMAPYGSSRW